MAASIRAIYRYPIKGLSPDPRTRVALKTGQTLPADRLYAIENGPTGFDPANPAYFPKQRFLMLMRNERLAALRTQFDEASHTLTIHWEGEEAVRADLRTAAGRVAVENFMTRYCADELRGPPKVLYGDGHSFSDVAKKVVSIINLASVAQIETRIGSAVDPVRFRANVYVDGWPAWHEFGLMGREIVAGTARLKVVKRIVRCAATNVDPATGIRDLHIPETLQKSFDHGDCGVYAEVIASGEIAVGDKIEAADLFAV
jgi:MOSC domain-containing protein